MSEVLLRASWFAYHPRRLEYCQRLIPPTALAMDDVIPDLHEPGQATVPGVDPYQISRSVETRYHGCSNGWFDGSMVATHVASRRHQ